MNNPPAFPRPGFTAESPEQARHQGVSQEGMTLRDYFAGMAMQGLIQFEYGGALTRKYDQSHEIANAGPKGESPQEYFARIAYSLADAMLKAREEQNP